MYTNARTERDDPMTRLAWDYYEENHEALLRIVRMTIRSRTWRAAVSFDEAMSEVASRLPDIMRCYDATKGSLDYHVRNNLRMYLFKLCQRVTQGERAVRVGSVTFTPMTQSLGLSFKNGDDARAAKERVQLILEHPDLHPTFRWLLKARYFDGFSVNEIAKLLNCRPKSARRYLADALETARILNATIK